MSTLLSPAQAAQVAQVSRRTITRAISAQALQATRDNKNQWRIRPEDLDAWRGAQGAQWAPSGHAQEGAHLAHPDAHLDAHPAQEFAHPDKALREELETLRKERDEAKQEMVVLTVRLEETEKRATILERAKDAAEADRDAWREQAQALASAQRPTIGTPEKSQEVPAVAPVVSESPKRSRGFLGRLLGR